MIIFLYGPDTYRSRKKLDELKEKFLREVDPTGAGLALLDGETATMEKINEAIAPSSLFVRKRMAIIENLFANKGQNIFLELAEYLKKHAKKDNDNIIIFLDPVSSGDDLNKAKSELFKLLKSEKFAMPEFKELSNTDATQWAKAEVEKRGGKISREAASALTAVLGSDLWRLGNEIEKLVNYKAGLKLDGAEEDFTIEIKDVDKFVRGAFDENIFALTDAISAKNKALALKLLEEQIEAGLTDFHLLNMITRQFKILIQIRQALDDGHSSNKMIKLLGVHPFIVQKGIGQARNFSMDILKAIFNKLVAVDYGMKTGQVDIKNELSLLISKL